LLSRFLLIAAAIYFLVVAPVNPALPGPHRVSHQGAGLRPVAAFFCTQPLG
jgi:hypothetical protein